MDTRHLPVLVLPGDHPVVVVVVAVVTEGTGDVEHLALKDVGVVASAGGVFWMLRREVFIKKAYKVT